MLFIKIDEVKLSKLISCYQKTLLQLIRHNVLDRYSDGESYVGKIGSFKFS